MSSTPSQAGSTRDPLASAIALALFALAALLGARLLQLGWRKWADVVVDFGRELYVPWRLAEGDTLFRDVAHFNGPLSPWINAALFRVTGPSYEALFSWNLLLFVVFLVLFARYMTRLSGALAAALAICFVVPSLGLAHLAGIANYNWLSPYSHELTHGIMLAFAALAVAGSALRAGAVGQPLAGKRLFATGLLLGLVFLTKAETTLAAAAGLGAILILSAVNRRAGARVALRELGTVALAAALPFALAVALYTPALGLSEALLANLGSWPGIFASETKQLLFYKVGMGTDAPGQNARLQLVSAAVVLAFVAPALAWARLAPAKLRKPAIDAGIALAALGLTFAIWHFAELPPRRLSRPLPVLTLAIALLATLRAWRSGGVWIERAGFAWLACALLLKMVLRARFEHYGFALALPASAVFAVGASSWLVAPRADLAGSARRSLVPAAVVAALFGAVGSDLWRTSTERYAGKQTVVASGGDRLLADGRGPFIAAALEQIEQRFGPDDTLLVLPEGVTLNYYARRRTPTRFVNFMPPELLLYGEDVILAELEAQPPDGVVLVHKDTSEYGFPLFGTHYGQRIAGWLQGRYELVWLDQRGHAPLQPGSVFGIAILR